MRIFYPISFLIFLISFSICPAIEVGEKVGSYQTAGIVFGSPAVGADGSIYFGSQDNVFYALHADGTLKWKFTEASDWIDSSPTLTDDGLVVFGSWDNYLYAVNRSDGSLVWKFETLNSITASPAVDDSGNLFFGSLDAYVYGLTPDGAQIWRTAVYAPVEANAIIGYDNVLYVGDTEGYLYAINKSTGAILWFFSVEDVYTIKSASDAVGFLSTPAMNQEGLLFIGCQNTYLYAIDTTLPSTVGSADRLSWSVYAEGEVDSSPVLAQNGDVIFSARDGYLYRISNTGIIDWELFVGEVAYSTPAVDVAGNISIIGYDNPNNTGSSQLITVNGSGEEIWSFEFMGYNDSSVTIAPDGSIYFGANDANLYKIKGENRLGFSDWPKFLGDRTHTNAATNVNNLDPLDFFPQLKDYNGNLVTNGSDEIIATTKFPIIYSNLMGWIECSAIDDAGTILLYSPKIGWLSPVSGSTTIYYHFNSSQWLNLLPDESSGKGTSQFVNLVNGLKIEF